MGNTTFGYDSEQDRIWLLYAPNQPRVWLTRRIAQGIAGPVAQLVERTVANFESSGLSAQDRTQTEHRLAITESPQGEPHYPFQVRQESRESTYQQGFVLCKVFHAHIETGGALIELTCEQHSVKFELTRQDLHLWLRAFKMALDDTGWNLDPPLPSWLKEPMLPAAVESLLKQPIPPELMQEMAESDPDAAFPAPTASANTTTPAPAAPAPAPAPAPTLTPAPAPAHVHAPAPAPVAARRAPAASPPAPKAAVAGKATSPRAERKKGQGTAASSPRTQGKTKAQSSRSAAAQKNTPRKAAAKKAIATGAAAKGTSRGASSTAAKRATSRNTR